MYRYQKKVDRTYVNLSIHNAEVTAAVAVALDPRRDRRRAGTAGRGACRVAARGHNHRRDDRSAPPPALAASRTGGISLALAGVSTRRPGPPFDLRQSTRCLMQKPAPHVSGCGSLRCRWLIRKPGPLFGLRQSALPQVGEGEGEGGEARQEGVKAGQGRKAGCDPSSGLPHAAFRVRCIQPLCHLSGLDRPCGRIRWRRGN